jgi:hypothetical protein
MKLDWIHSRGENWPTLFNKLWKYNQETDPCPDVSKMPHIPNLEPLNRESWLRAPLCSDRRAEQKLSVIVESWRDHNTAWAPSGHEVCRA